MMNGKRNTVRFPLVVGAVDAFEQIDFEGLSDMIGSREGP